MEFQTTPFFQAIQEFCVPPPAATPHAPLASLAPFAVLAALSQSSTSGRPAPEPL